MGVRSWLGAALTVAVVVAPGCTCRGGGRGDDDLRTFEPGASSVAASVPLEQSDGTESEAASPSSAPVPGEGASAEAPQGLCPPGAVVTYPLFTSGKRFAAGDGPNRLGSGDVDADGDTDVFVVGLGGTWLLENDGSGALAAPQSIRAGEAQALRVADLDGDTDLDLVLVGVGGGGPALFVLGGTSTGTFYAGPDLDIGGADSFVHEQDVVVGDFDDDDVPDLVTSRMLFMKGLGELAFTTAAYTPESPTSANFIEAVDLNHDGQLDVVRSYRPGSSSLLDVHVSNANGTFSSPSAPSAPPPLYDRAAAGLLDADAEVDLVVTSDQGPIVLRGLGATGSYGFEAPSEPSGVRTRFVVLAEVTDDDDLDLIYSDATDGRLRVHLRPGRGDGTWDDPLHLVMPAPAPQADGQSDGIAVNLDHDDVLDLVVSDRANDSVIVFRGFRGAACETPAAPPVASACATGWALCPGGATCCPDGYACDEADAACMTVDPPVATTCSARPNGPASTTKPTPGVSTRAAPTGTRSVAATSAAWKAARAPTGHAAVPPTRPAAATFAARSGGRARRACAPRPAKRTGSRSRAATCAAPTGPPATTASAGWRAPNRSRRRAGTGAVPGMRRASTVSADARRRIPWRVGTCAASTAPPVSTACAAALPIVPSAARSAVARATSANAASACRTREAVAAARAPAACMAPEGRA